MPLTGIKSDSAVRKLIYGHRTNPSNLRWKEPTELWNSWSMEGEWGGNIESLWTPARINTSHSQ